MKTVVNREQVAHLFANQSQDHATTSSRNFYFYGNKCNSYGAHFRAAVHHGDCVLLNRETYSNTTARQMSALRYACSHLVTFEVANPDAETKPEHRDNFRAMVREYETEILRASRARVYNSTETAERMLNNANAYAARFKIGNRLQPIALENAKAVNAARKQKDNAAYKRAEKARAKAAKLAAEKRAADDKKNAEKWRAGVYHFPLHHIPVMCRLTSDGQTVQTSHGAEFPAKHARRWIQFVIGLFLSGTDWTRNGDKIRLGHFQIDHVNGAAGLLRAGCHTVTRTEVERLAELLRATISGYTSEGSI